MSGIEEVAAATTEHAGKEPGDTRGTVANLFCESVDLGEGASPGGIRRAEDTRLAGIIGRKLRKARRLAGFSEMAAALALSQEGMSMISLYENGHRLPPLSNLRVLAQLYGVTTDYLLDMHDDILCAPEEGNQAVLRGVISTSLNLQFHAFTDALSRRSAVMIESLSADRALLGQLGTVAIELASALKVFKTHAPNFDEIRGGAKLDRLVGELHVSMSDQIRRKKQEEALAEHEPYSLAPEQIAKQVQQLLF